MIQLVLHSEGEDIGGYSEDDIEAMRDAGLTDEDIAEITGTSQKYEGTQPSESKQPNDESVVVIPNNPDETTRVDYELIYYINDINTENTQVLMEYGKRDELKNVYTYGNERISVETVADTYNTKTDDYETDYYLYDGRGSVAQVVSSEDIVECYTYDPFGNVTSGEPVFDSYYGYNAEDTNPVTGLQYLRARYYDTESGRFSVADTYLGDVSKPLTLNRYTYTVNNPVMQVDPSGHIAGWIVAGLIILGGVLLLTGCSTDDSDSGNDQNHAPSVSKEDAEQIVDEMLPDIEEINELDEEIEQYVSGKKKAEEGKSLTELIRELNEKRAKLCDDLEERQKIIEDYNNSNPNKTVEIPQLPDLDKSSFAFEENSSSDDLSNQEKHENALIIYEYLTEKGWSPNAICALLGNMEVESVTLNPGKQQNGGGPGYGLVQWDPASKYTDWASENGYADDSLIGQLEFLMYSMKPGNGEWFRNSKYSEYYLSSSEFISSDESVEYLTQVFLWSYERPSVSHMDRRLEKANYWYEYFN